MQRSFQNTLQQAKDCLNRGQTAKAEQLVTKVIHKSPNNCQALFLLGIIAGQTGDLNKSVKSFEKLLALQPATPEIYYNLATTLMKQEKYSAAEPLLRKTLELKEDFIEAYINLGHVLHKLNNHRKAEACFRQAVERAPADPIANYNLGTALLHRKQLAEAANCFQAALDINPAYVEALLSLCQTYKESGRPDEAVRCLRKAAARQPDNAAVFYHLGEELRRQENYEEACTTYQKTIELNSRMKAAYINWGVCLQALKKPLAAIGAYNQALAIEPSPEICGNRAQAILQSGNLELGFKEYEWRTKVTEHRPLFEWCCHKPRWQGELFSGKRLLVHHEQGLGDTLQFVRYLPLVKARGGIVIFSTKQALLRLLKNFPGIDQLVEHAEEPITNLNYDLAIPQMSLPAVFGSTLATIPAKVPYIQANPALSRKWAKNMIANGKLKVGLVWAGNPNHVEGLIRTCGLAALKPLAAVAAAVDFYSLQVGGAAKELKNPPDGLAVIDLTRRIKDFADTAALVDNLDLVISVDTAVAHLAGAMGKPVWNLLPFASEWRWLAAGNNSPWYPTMRLFRQPKPQDWPAVLHEVTAALQSMATSHSRPATAST
ncbi:MAG TPA: tetratricopeptide repeat protein [Methylomusa anaerophila]|uniref:TPR repeat-containing protein YrrB n=1 Tax=Methylomusa anaerophila TaxID=1930071 RepID=A0A348AKR2_9FIRM|nr:tetratricopeptide repeat protein [Methylomusa anaerophila]BBB91660.1 TPR repeat-containing protein YrrB [Methylomusa anaerophila]HML88606.1 tetratricopeptide repeat protein [Methylomusa anaerophila]